MQQLRLDELLRYCLSGGIGLVVFSLSFRGVLERLGGLTGNTHLELASEAAILGISILIGSLVYSLHRAIIYPLIFRFWTLLLCWRVYKFHYSYLFPFVASPLEVTLDLHRWQRRQEDHSFASGQLEWGAQVHFLYCSTWAIIAALIVGGILGLTPSTLRPSFCWLAGLCLAAAFISNGRLAYYDAFLAREQLAETTLTKQHCFKQLSDL